MNLVLPGRASTGDEARDRPLADAVLALATPALSHLRGTVLEVPLPPAPWGYLHVLRGSVDLGGTRLAPGDAARLTGEAPRTLRTDGPAEYLYWAMRSGPAVG